MKNINNILMKAKLKYYKKYKKREQEQDLDLNNQSFHLYYRPAFKTNIYHKLNVSYSIRYVIIKTCFS